MVSPESNEPDLENRAAGGPGEEFTNRQVVNALLEQGRQPAEINREFVEGTNKMDTYLAYFRGEYALDVAQRNASLIADDMGYGMILQLTREEMIGFSKMARGVGKPEGDVKSFREADLVLLARDDSGHPAYIAVEASFTVSGRDIRRARRNAEYLQELTGLPAKGAVAGVEIAPGREQNAITDGVHCYHIPVRDLESD